MQFVLAGALYLMGGWPFVIWGVFVRLVVVYHCTWFVNSATHKFGYRSYETTDMSTNCWWVALVTYGEGWHNNHHAFQHSARHGLKWWEFDITWIHIYLLQKLGLARKVKLANS
jgi:stearoyl-CoA desaturase (delta-9 desaturase)